MVEHADRVAASQNMLGTDFIFSKTLRTGGGRSCGPPPPDRVAPPAATLLRLRPSSGMCSFSPRPPGRIESRMASRLPCETRLPSSALSWRSFPAVRRQCQRPPPTQIRPYPPRRQKLFKHCPPPVDMRVFEEYQALKKNIGLAEQEIVTLVYIQYS
jgi:hypothetical protein